MHLFKIFLAFCVAANYPMILCAEDAKAQMISLLTGQHEQGKLLVNDITFLDSNDKAANGRKQVSDFYYIVWSNSDFACASVNDKVLPDNIKEAFPLKYVEKVCVGQLSGQKWQATKNVLITCDSVKGGGDGSVFAGDLSQVDMLSTLKDEIFQFGFPPFADIKTNISDGLDFTDPTGVKFFAKLDVSNDHLKGVDLDAYGQQYKIDYDGWMTNGSFVYPSGWSLSQVVKGSSNDSANMIKRVFIRLAEIDSTASPLNCRWDNFVDMRFFRHMSQSNGMAFEVKQSGIVPVVIGGNEPPPLPFLTPGTARLIVLVLMFISSTSILILVVWKQVRTNKNKQNKQNKQNK